MKRQSSQETQDFVAYDGYGLSCPHCNHISTEEDPVVRKNVHIGGIGDVAVLQCADEQACWDRWDEQHGFSKCPECGSLVVQDTPLGPRCLVCGRATQSVSTSQFVRERRASYGTRAERLPILATRH